MAQLVEQLIRNQQVAGSNPASSSKSQRTDKSLSSGFLSCLSVARNGSVRTLTRNLMGAFQGLYLIYFMVSVQNGLKLMQLTKLSGFSVVLLSILTLGIFSLVWQWNVGKSLKNLRAGDCRVICLILSLLIFGILINPLIIQGKINRYNKEKQQKPRYA